MRARLRKQLRAIPDARLTFLSAEGGSGYQQILTGSNPDNLQAASLQLERQMRGLSELADPRPTRPPIGPEIIIRPKADEAARLGVSSDVIANIARVGFHFLPGDAQSAEFRLSLESEGVRASEIWLYRWSA